MSGVSCLARWALVLSLLCLASCTSYGPTVSVGADEVAKLLSGEALFGDKGQDIPLPDEDLFAVTDEMKAFAEANVPANLSISSRAQHLHQALLMPGSLGLVYDPYVTSTAVEAFDVQQGNCLTFTALYYSLARHLGIKAYINQVDVPASWDLQGKSTYVFFRHVNIKVKVGNGSMVVDLDLANYSAKYNQRRIDEGALRVQYFNNRAMELLNGGDTAAAFRYLKKAIELDSEQAFLWSNLGILFKRNHLLREAEVAFRKALVIEPNNNTAASNLARLYERLGDVELAQQFHDLVSFYRNKNPFYQYHLAEESLISGDLEEALALVRKAIRGAKTEHRFYDLQAQVYVAQGKPEKAKKSWDKAAQLTESVSSQAYQRRAGGLRRSDRISVY